MILGDYHTHTRYSHGTGSVMDNALAAEKCGLKQVAITDHGLRHMAFNIKYRQLNSFFADVKEANEKTSVKVLAGIENNIYSIDGLFDCDPVTLDELDVIMGGYHKAVRVRSARDFFKYALPNLASDLFGHRFSKKLIALNTDVYLKLIENEDVDFITHINYGLRSDILTVARQCKKFGTFIELNGKRVNFSDSELEKMTEEGVQFILSSDAHSPERVGDVSMPLAIVERLHIPYNQIVNWEAIPKFRSQKAKGLYDSDNG